MGKIAKWAGPTVPAEPSTFGALDTAHEYADEAPPADSEPAAEPPDPTPGPGPGQDSMPEPSLPASSEPPAAAEPDAPAEITGEGGVVVPKAGAGDAGEGTESAA